MTLARYESRAERRALLTSLHRAAIEGAAPFPRTRDAVARWLAAARDAMPVHAPSVSRAHLFALGKAAPSMAAGAVYALDQSEWVVAGGVVVAASRIPTDASVESGGTLPDTLLVRIGDHPVPDIGSLAAADAIARAVSAIEPGDTAIVLLSGGATSLCAAPCPELVAAIGHPAAAQRLLGTLVLTLMQHGLAIHEMNAIRRRLLRWGAGRLATAINARGAASIPVFAISDVIGDDPAVIGSGPCTADPYSAIDTLALIDAHELRGVLDPTVANALGLQGAQSVTVSPPSPSHQAFHLVRYEIVARNEDACLAVSQAARAAGVDRVLYYDAPLEGEADALGQAIALGVLKAATLSEADAILIWGGEPTVSMHALEQRVAQAESDNDALPSETPLGGRMQALALAAATVLDGSGPPAQGDASRISILAAGTDGRDGPTDAAGAIVDDQTIARAERAGRDPSRDLRLSSSYRSLDAAGALLRTGHTGTNVMDVVIAYVAKVTDSRSNPSP